MIKEIYNWILLDHGLGIDYRQSTLESIWSKRFQYWKKMTGKKERENEIHCYESFIDQRNEIKETNWNWIFLHYFE